MGIIYQADAFSIIPRLVSICQDVQLQYKSKQGPVNRVIYFIVCVTPTQKAAALLI